MKPNTPAEIRQKIGTKIPAEIFEAVNDLLVQHIRVQGSEITATIYQNDLEDILSVKMPSTPVNEMINKGWFEIETPYRDAGWRVVYDKPGYSESYRAYWKFTGRVDEKVNYAEG